MHASVFLAYNILEPRHVEEPQRVGDKLKPHLLGEMPLEAVLFWKYGPYCQMPNEPYNSRFPITLTRKKYPADWASVCGS